MLGWDRLDLELELDQYFENLCEYQRKSQFFKFLFSRKKLQNIFYKMKPVLGTNFIVLIISNTSESKTTYGVSPQYTYGIK